MPQYVEWVPSLRTGHELIDAQHEVLFALCNRLADHCGGRDGAVDEAGFDQALAQLKVQARRHFEAEAAALAGSRPDGDSDEQRAEHEEFEFLTNEVATTSNFDRVELQRFLAVWWLGHIRGMAAEQAASGV